MVSAVNALGEMRVEQQHRFETQSPLVSSKQLALLVHVAAGCLMDSIDDDPELAECHECLERK